MPPGRALALAAGGLGFAAGAVLDVVPSGTALPPPWPPLRPATSAASALNFCGYGLMKGLEHFVARPEAERRVRDPQHIRAPGDLHAQVRRHSGLELEARVGHVDDRRVGRHILDDDRLQANLGDHALELFARICVYSKRHVLVGPDAADIGFVDVGVDLHLRQVRGDDKENRRLHAGGDCLSDVHAALDHDAVDGRVDGAVIEVDLRLAQAGLRLDDGGLRRVLRRDRRLQCRLAAVDGDLRRVEILGRDQLLGGEVLRADVFLLRVDKSDLVAIDIGFRARDVGLRFLQVGLRLIDLRLEERRVEPCDHLTLLDD